MNEIIYIFRFFREIEMGLLLPSRDKHLTFAYKYMILLTSNPAKSSETSE